MWGLSRTKLTKPFREAFTKLNSLNSLNTCFELHTATLENVESILKLLGRRNSVWLKQLEIPERSNLTYFLFAGRQAPQNILQLPSLKKALHNEEHDGVTLIYVQKVSDGSTIHINILDYLESCGLIDANSDSDLPVAFLHSKLTEETKKHILEKAVAKKIKVLIATSAAGAGINLPVTQFIGWGLDREPTGVIQSQGRTARSPLRCEGIIIWVHNPKLHGQGVPSQSKVREMLNSHCLRQTMNGWFDHGVSTVPVSNPEAEFCCSPCMLSCIENTNCSTCSDKLATFEPEISFDEKSFVSKLTQFLSSININERSPELTPVYKERSLGKTNYMWQ